jgi:hypothetical protein
MHFFNLFILLNGVVDLYLLKNGKRKTSGKDQRYEENTDLDNPLLQKINSYQLKKKILETLLDNKTNEINKLYLIQNLHLEMGDTSIQTFNLTGGNIFKDFYFEHDIWCE